MEISISKKHKRRSKKVKSPDAQNRSTFLKMLFGYLSGDTGSTIMKHFVEGNKKFIEEWKAVDAYVQKSFKPADDKGATDDKGPSNESKH